MAREIVIGIIIRGKDAAGPELDKAGQGAKRLGDETEKAGRKAREAAKETLTFGKVVSTMKNTLELAERAWRMFSATVGAWVRSSLESRSQFDSSRRAIDEFQKATSLLGRTLGDVILPVLAGFAQAFTPLLTATQKWIEQNRELIGTRLVEWLTTAGRVLLAGLVAGAIAAARAWVGWQEVIGTTKMLFYSFVQDALNGYEGLLKAAAALAARAGNKELRLEILRTAFAVHQLAEGYERSADIAAAEVARNIRELDALEAKVQAAGDAINDAIGRGAVLAFEKLGRAAQRAGRAFDPKAFTAGVNELIADYEKIRELERRAEGDQAKKVSEDRWADLAGRARRVQEQAASAATGFATTTVNFISTVIGAAMDGTREMGEVIGDFFKNLGISILETVGQVLIKLLVLKALMLIFSGPLGFIGSLLGFSRGGLVPGYAAGGLVQSFAPGGFVSGGVPGRDSVPAMLMPGEFVLPRHVVQAIRTGSPPSSGPSSEPRPAPTRGGDTFVISTALPTSATAAERIMRDQIGPLQRRQRRRV